MGPHTLVGGAVAVVVVAGLQQEGVAGHGDIVAVEGVGFGDDLRHALPLLRRGAGEAEEAEEKEEQRERGRQFHAAKVLTFSK